MRAVELWQRAPDGLQIASWMTRLDADPKKFLEGLSNDEPQRRKMHVMNNHQPYARRCKTFHRRVLQKQVSRPNHSDSCYFLAGVYTMPSPDKPEGPPEEPHGDPNEEPHW